MKKILIIVFMMYGCSSSGWTEKQMDKCIKFASLVTEETVCVCDKLQQEFPDFNKLEKVMEDDGSTMDSMSILYIYSECSGILEFLK